MFLLAGVVFALHALGRAGKDSAASSALKNVTDAFTNANIVPDIIPTFNPNATVSPIITDMSGPIQVLPGMSLGVNDTQNAPQYLLASNVTDLSKANTSWVIAIVDPDAPSPQFLHFLGRDFVVDPVLTVQGGGLTNATGLMNMSQAVVEFTAPSPLPGPAHRYVVLVYEQPSDFNTTASAFFNITDGVDISRVGFNVSDFATKTSLGDPVAGSFFIVGVADSDTTSTAVMTSTSIATSTAVMESTTVKTMTATRTSTSDETSTAAVTSTSEETSTAAVTATSAETSTATVTSTKSTTLETSTVSTATVTSTTVRTSSAAVSSTADSPSSATTTTSTTITTSTRIMTSTTIATSSGTAAESSSASQSAPASALAPPPPFSPSPQQPAAIATNTPSGAEKVTSRMSLLVITALSLGLVLV